MTKNEFLELLRAALSGEIPDLEIESNMKYYEEYIRTEGYKTSEEEVINQLGDPRLIAKTIIDTYQLSHEPMFQNTNRQKSFYDNDSSYNKYEGYKEDYSYDTGHNKNGDSSGRNFSFHVGTSLTWIQKALIITIIVLLIIVLVFVGGVLLNILFTVAVPLLLIYIVYKIIKEVLK
jgi:uncharacterized membrane protein